jgi:hypothetical protein
MDIDEGGALTPSPAALSPMLRPQLFRPKKSVKLGDFVAAQSPSTVDRLHVAPHVRVVSERCAGVRISQCNS